MPIYCHTVKTKLRLEICWEVTQGGPDPADPCFGSTSDTNTDPDDNIDPDEESSDSSSSTSSTSAQAGPDPIIVVPPGAGGTVDPDTVQYIASINPGYVHANISGDYQAMSIPSNLVAMRNLSTGDWVIRDPAGIRPDRTVGNRSSNGAVMTVFMWDYRDDVFVWMDDHSLQRRTKDGIVIESVTLPATVADGTATDYAVQWRSGKRNSNNTQDGLFIVGYIETPDYLFVLPISTNPLSFDIANGFWVHEVTGIALLTSLHELPNQKTDGWILTPKSPPLHPELDVYQQTLFDFQPGRDVSMTEIETHITGNDWSHETTDGNLLAFYSSITDRIEIVDMSGLLETPKDTTFPVVRAIETIEVSTAYGAPGEYIQYTHGHITNGRLVFGVYRSGTKFGVMYYDFATDAVYPILTDFDAGLLISDTPQPSISKDGKVACWISDGGLQIYPVDEPGTLDVDILSPWPAEARTPFMHWEAGDITKADWDAFRATMGVDSVTGTPKPKDNSYSIANPRGGQISPNIKNEVPNMNEDGSLYFNVHSGSHNIHSLMRFWKPGATDTLAWFKARILYRMDFEFELLDGSGVDWSVDPQVPDVAGDAVRWAILHEQWGNYSTWNTIPAVDRPTSRLSPVFALELTAEDTNDGNAITTDDLTLITRIRGTSNPDGLIPWVTDMRLTSPISLGINRFSVLWKADPTGTESYCRVWHNGAVIHEVTGTVAVPVPMGTPFDANGNYVLPNVAAASGGNSSTGLYTPMDFASPGVESNLTLVKHWKIN